MGVCPDGTYASGLLCYTRCPADKPFTPTPADQFCEWQCHVQPMRALVSNPAAHLCWRPLSFCSPCCRRLRGVRLRHHAGRGLPLLWPLPRVRPDRLQVRLRHPQAQRDPQVSVNAVEWSRCRPVSRARQVPKQPLFTWLAWRRRNSAGVEKRCPSDKPDKFLNFCYNRCRNVSDRVRTPHELLEVLPQLHARTDGVVCAAAVCVRRATAR